ncbi:hypothetical protein [Viscerimonas tarda]
MKRNEVSDWGQGGTAFFSPTPKVLNNNEIAFFNIVIKHNGNYVTNEFD